MRVMKTGGRRAGRTALVAALAALATLLGGCSLPERESARTPEQTEGTSSNLDGTPSNQKRVFLLRLIGLCAGVNIFARSKTEEHPDGPPAGAVADRLDALILAALANAPDVDQDKLLEMVAKLSEFAQSVRNLDKVGSADTEQAEKVTAEAKAAADEAAVRYGMPHLDECEKHMQQWQELPNLPLAVQQFGTAVVNGRIWVVGGLTGKAEAQASAKVFFFDPVLEKWFEGPPLPTPLHHVMAVAYQNALVVIGGWVPAGGKARGTTSAQVLKLQDSKWETMPSLNHARAAGAAAVVGDQIVVVGGIDSEEIATTEVFDGSTWRDGAAIPVPGDHLGAVSDGKVLYAVGGRRDLDASQSTAALQRYDPAANTWSKLADMPATRGGLGAAYADGRIYAVGGETANSAQNVVESFDVAAGSWTSDAALPHGVHGLGVAVVNGILYAIGGATEAGHSNSTDAVLGLSLTGSPMPPSTSTPRTADTPTTAGTSSTVGSASTGSVADSPDLSACPETLAEHWACLSSARLRADGGLDISYRTNFAPSSKQDKAHRHLHVFTAKPDGRGGTIPTAAAMQGNAGAQQGSWYSIFARDDSVIPPRAKTTGKKRPLDTSAPLLCVRVAMGVHTLAKDRNGGLNTGNCVTIQR